MEGLGQHGRLARQHVGLIQGDGGEAGDEDDPQGGMQVAGAARQFDAVDPRHDHVGQEQIDLVAGGPAQRRIAVAQGAHLVPGAAQRAGEEYPDAVVVFGEKDACHEARIPVS